VKVEEIEDFKDTYIKSKTVHGIMKILAYKCKTDLEKNYISSFAGLYIIFMAMLTMPSKKH